MGSDLRSNRTQQSWCKQASEHPDPTIVRHSANGRPVSKWAEFDKLGAYKVYILRDHAGNVLYVGAAKSLSARMAGRAKVAPWFSEVCHWQTAVEGFTSSQDTADRERELIESLAPLHNISGTPAMPYIPYTGGRDEAPALRYGPDKPDLQHVHRTVQHFGDMSVSGAYLLVDDLEWARKQSLLASQLGTSADELDGLSRLPQSLLWSDEVEAAMRVLQKLAAYHVPLQR